ncbi:MAG: hypothetical protein ACREEE_03665 [Dongiaceae bacterium]
MLCRAVIDHATGLEIPALHLGTDDEAAARLYGDLGFRVLERTSCYGEPSHILMIRRLDRRD